MPKLGGDNRTTKLYLPSTEHEPQEADRAWVEVRNRLKGGDLVDIEEMSDGSNARRGLIALEKLIVNWNFTQDGTPNTPVLPVNEENIRQLEDDDFEFLSSWLLNNVINKPVGMTDAEKKSSPSTSPTSGTDITQAPPASPTTMIPIA